MENKMIWAFLIHLSAHMWDDSTTPSRGLYLAPDYNENNNTDLETWDTVIAALPAYGINTLVIDLGDAIQYESHPEISAPDAWSKDFFVKKLDEIRALGIQPIPKLNFSAAHDTWLHQYNRMISTPTYYKVCANLIKEVCELFGYPPLFHLGMDEESERFQKHFDMITVRTEALWWHDLGFLFRECEKHGARPWIWSAHSLMTFGDDSFKKNMPHSVLQCSGYHSKLNNEHFPAKDAEKLSRVMHVFEFLANERYEQTALTSTWSYYRNPQQILGLCKDRIDPSLVKGFISASWLRTFRGYSHGMIYDAQLLHRARELVYPETL